MGEKSIVEQKWNECCHFFYEMEKENFDPEKYEINLSAFINSTRNISYALQKDGKDRVFFQKRRLEKQEFMKKDNLMKFFYELRNYSVKEANNKISEFSGLSMRHSLKFDGEGGCMATLLSRDGSIIGEKEIKNDPSAEFFLGGIGISFDSGLREKMYFFDKIDGLDLDFIGVRSITELSFEYLDKLKNIVGEYFENIH